MKERRIEKVKSLLQREISQILLKEIEFPGSLVTVTGVSLTPDFSKAKVLITVFPEQKEKDVLKKLKEESSFIRFTLGKKLTLKPIPKISFEIDEGAKNLYLIDKFSAQHERKFGKD